MLDPRWLKVWRELGTQRARTALVVLALAAALAGAGTILVSWALLRVATVEGYRASLPASATLRIADTDAATMDRVLQVLRNRSDLAAARARRVVLAGLQGQGPWRNALLIGIDAADAPLAGQRIGRLRSEAGPWPPPPGELAIERSSLEFSGVTLGEPLLLRRGAGDTLPAAARSIVRDVSLAPGWMEHLVVAFASRETLASLGLGSAFNELQVRVRDADASRAAVRAIAATLRDDLSRLGVQVISVDVPEPGEHVHARQMNSLLMTQGSFGAMALLASAVLVVNLLHALLAAQRRPIAVMKVLGATPRALTAMHLALAAAFGAAASLLALPAALLAGRRYAAFKAELLNFPLEGTAVPWWCVALLLAVGLLLPLAAAWLPVRSACRTSAADGLRDIGIVEPGAPLFARRLLGAQRWPRPLALALGNAFRRRQRLVLTLAALAIGGAVLVAADNLRRAVQGSVNLLFAAQRYDLTLRLATPHDAAAAVAAAAAVPGVAAVEGWRGRRAQRVGADGTLQDSLSLVGVPLASKLLQPPVLRGHWLDGAAAAEPPSLVLSRSLALDHDDLQPGQTLRLSIDNVTVGWTIAGIVDSGPQPLAYVSRAALNRVAGEGGDVATTLVVALQPRGAAGQLDATMRLRAALADAGMPVAASQLQGENRRVVEDHLLMVVDFLGAMGWVMMAVGGFALASTMGLAVLERRREIGVLRAIGAGHGRVMALFQAEGLVIVLLAWLVSLPLSLPLSLLLGEAFGRVMFRVGNVWWPEPALALRWLAVLVLVSFAACALPAWRALRLPAARALAYE